jgi:hypothetical protein
MATQKVMNELYDDFFLEQTFNHPKMRERAPQKIVRIFRSQSKSKMQWILPIAAQTNLM